MQAIFLAVDSANTLPY